MLLQAAADAAAAAPAVSAAAAATAVSAAAAAKHQTAAADLYQACLWVVDVGSASHGR